MKSFWNQRYSAQEYAYGQEPNLFYKECMEKIRPGRILFPGEGEGRNAVYAAKLGWDVVAFDSAEQGKIKAEKLAQQFEVDIDYKLLEADDASFPVNSFDCIVFIFVHLPAEKRRAFHQKMLNYLKPGGMVIFEGFEKQQIQLNTGGPKLENMLFSKNDLAEDFKSLNILEMEALKAEISEGQFHQGLAHVIRFVGEKKYL